MVDVIDRNRRVEIRNELDEHVRDGTSPKRIAAYIRQYPEFFEVPVSAATIRRFLDTDPLSTKVGQDRIATLAKYLAAVKAEAGRFPGALPTGSSHTPAIGSGELFSTASAFFRMRPEKAEQLQEPTLGVYAFYAYSEEGKTRVCKGAIRFFVDANGLLCVEEQQESVPDGGEEPYREQFSGHFLFRKDSVIVIQRHSKESIPKIYVLSMENYRDKDGRILVMTGGLLKIGDKMDVFLGNIHVVREDAAFETCAMLSPAKVPKRILEALDIGKWSAR